MTGYLTILKVRYRDILNYVIDIPEELYPQEVLKLLLQPLVENALYHGIKNRRGKGTVRISVWEENEWLHFSVKDDGAGMTPEHLEQVRRGLGRRRAGQRRLWAVQRQQAHQAVLQSAGRAAH